MAANLKVVLASCVVFFWAAIFPAAVHATNVDLTHFPTTGMPVPDGTVLSDQWRPIGILFSASGPTPVNPIKDFTNTLFFNPDQFGNVAIFTFVIPGGATPTHATRFSLRAGFDPGESAELVGLDDFGNVVAEDDVVPADIGSSRKFITMTITGYFARVEWRTQGNPGIAADTLQFDLTRNAAPTLNHAALLVISLCLVTFGIIRLRRSARLPQPQ